MHLRRTYQAIKNIREWDTGEWLKDCMGVTTHCASGHDARLKLIKLLDELYDAAKLNKKKNPD